MRILFTGASSFTGHWFVRVLHEAGHEVLAAFQSEAKEYEGVRGERVARLREACHPLFGTSFGDDAFLAAIRDGGSWDLLCHHGAQVGDYRSEEFDVAGALRANTQRLGRVLTELASTGCRRVAITGSVFEPGEGAGSRPLRAFSPYALSKRFTAECFRYHAERQGFSLGKFVIPNPFGPLEEERFTAYLARTWLSGQVAEVRTPAYVRDNIHVRLLARCYRRFVEELPSDGGFHRCAPSGYAGSQEDFVRRFARELEPRLGVACAVEFREQREFSEPRVRIHTDVPDAAALGFREGEAWDELAEHYRERFGSGPRA